MISADGILCSVGDISIHLVYVNRRLSPVSVRSSLDPFSLRLANVSR